VGWGVGGGGGEEKGRRVSLLTHPKSRMNKREERSAPEKRGKRGGGESIAMVEPSYA